MTRFLCRAIAYRHRSGPIIFEPWGQAVACNQVLSQRFDLQVDASGFSFAATSKGRSRNLTNKLNDGFECRKVCLWPSLQHERLPAANFRRVVAEHGVKPASRLVGISAKEVAGSLCSNHVQRARHGESLRVQIAHRSLQRPMSHRLLNCPRISATV